VIGAIPTSHDLEPFFHVTVLSNFSRAYDKYGRVYSKAHIPESRYPDCFYVLPLAELAVGREKASDLLARTGFSADELLVLEARLAPAALQPHPRGGSGQVWPSPELPVHAVHRLVGVNLTRTSPEDAMARSLALRGDGFIPYASLRPRSISFLPIARGCQAACPFCFSTASASAEQRQTRLDPATVDMWLRLARRRGAERAVITGGGEPTLLGTPGIEALVRACATAFSSVILITNGYTLATADDPVRSLLGLRRAGLSVLAVSRHHPDETTNTRLMNLETRTPLLLDAHRRARAELKGQRLRLVCVLQRGGVESVDDVARYVAWAADQGVDEVCFKELYVSTSLESVYHSNAANAWSASRQVPLRTVIDWATQQGHAIVSRLPWNAPIIEAVAAGRSLRVAAYSEPSLFWERSNGIARSWNVMADGTCLASLEDRASVVTPDVVGAQ
jgi:pyruvate-formate lyase-activating enzyme